jgi:hypothetical protein
MSESQTFAIFAGQKYMSLETVRKNGTASVRRCGSPASHPAGTPATLYFYTIGDTGKVKRIRNNPRCAHRAMRHSRERKGSVGRRARGNIVGDGAKRGMKLLDRNTCRGDSFLGFSPCLAGASAWCWRCTRHKHSQAAIICRVFQEFTCFFLLDLAKEKTKIG